MSEKKAHMLDLSKLTRQQLRELEEKEKTKGQILFDRFMIMLPILCGLFAIFEYKVVPDNSANSNPNTYVNLLSVLIGAYVIYVAFAFVKKIKNLNFYRI